MEQATFTYAVRHDNIEAIYKKLEERRDMADVTDLLKELHRIVNEAIRAGRAGKGEAGKPESIGGGDQAHRAA